MSTESASKLVLDNLRIASPCQMSWDDMDRTAEESARFCQSCTKNVYDVSLMSRTEAELLLQRATVNNPDGSVCLRLYKRQDGTVLTDDCPVALKRIRNLWRKLQGVAAGIFAFAISGGAASAQDNGGLIMGKVAPSSMNKPTQRLNPKGNQNGALMGDPMTGNVAPGPQVMLGSPVPTKPVPLGGKPVSAVTFNHQAMALPGMQALFDRLKPLEMRPQPSDAEKLKIAKLHLDIAKLADSKNIPLFARGHYQSAKNMALSVPGQDALVEDITKRYNRNSTKLKMPSCDQ